MKKTFVRISEHTNTHSNPVSRKTGQIPPAAVGGFDTREEKENDSRSGLCPLVQWDWFFYTVFFFADDDIDDDGDVSTYSFVLDQRMK